MLKILTSIFIFMCTLSYPRALSFNGLYNDMSATATQTENLLNYAINQDSDFLEKDFVIFRDSQNSYYIVWGDLAYSNNSVTGGEIDYIRYYRPDGQTVFTYLVGNDTSFTLSNINYLVTSNIDGLGISSPTFNTMHYEYKSMMLSIFITSCLSGIFILKLTRKE